MSAFAPDSVDRAERLLGDAARAHVAGRERIRLALIDLFLPDGRRLRDIERATAANLLTRLIATIEDELRETTAERLAATDPALASALRDGTTPIAAPLMERAGLLRDPELVALLLRRAEEHRLSTTLRLTAAREMEAGGPPPLLDALIGADDPALADAAMALVVAESRRIDRFRDPVLARTDLPAEAQHRLVWRVAASLRRYLIDIGRLAPAAADQAVAPAALAMLAGYDESATLDGRALALALALRGAGRLDDSLIVQALREGRIALAVAAIGLRAGVPFDIAWEMLFDPGGSRLAVILRSIGMDAEHAAQILLCAVPPDLDGEMVANRIDAFALLDPARAEAAMRQWRLEPAFRDAIDALETGLAS